MTTGKDPTPAPRDAIALLKADHHAVKALFADFDAAEGKARKSIAAHLCTELSVHAQIEEEILYPSARETLGTPGAALLDEAAVEHGTAKDLIAKIQKSGASHPLFAAWVTVLGEYIAHHVAEEEGELFPKLRKSDLDLVDIGAQLSRRKAELMLNFAKPSASADEEESTEMPPVVPRGPASKSDGAKSRNGF